MKSTHLGPLIALSALAVAPSVAFAQEPASTPGTSIATTAEPAPSLTSPATDATPVQSTPQASSEASTPSSSTPASTPSASTPADTTPQSSDPNIADVTGAVKGESKRRAARRKAQADQAERTDDPTPSTQATDPTLIDPSLLNVTSVPNFFIQDFDIPPFLLPIYQAAGSEYGIRWEVLAGINKVETDYGRNLNVSSAGALGWMQFMPSTWEQYGVDADGNGVKDPFNPADAIFAAARYLKAAGGDTNLQQGIFAYNHASWYVDEVLANARAVAAIPDSLINSLTGLTQGIFPVAGDTDKIDYAGKTKDTGDKVTADENAADTVTGDDKRNSIEVTAPEDSKVVATQDGVIEKVGESEKLGKYVRLRDSYGNRYTYAHLGEIQDKVPVPKPVKDDKDATDESESASDPVTGTTPADAAPTTPATVGGDQSLDPTDPAPTTAATDDSLDPAAGTSPRTPAQTTPVTTSPQAAALSTTPTVPTPSSTSRDRLARSGETSTPEVTSKNLAEKPRRIRYAARDQVSAPNAKAEPASAEGSRLYAHPSRPAAYAAGGAEQLNPTIDAPATEAPVGELSKYFSIDYGLKASDVNLKKLKAGQAVIAGTVLGKTQISTDGSKASKVTFQIRPAGKAAPRIDPSPILDGWRLSDKTSFFEEQAKRQIATGQDPAQPTVGQILLMGKQELQQRVLADKRITIYPGGQRDIESGQIDQRVLALLEVMATKDMTPVVTALKSGHGELTSSGNVSEHSYGSAVDIGSVYGTVISPSTQGPGSVTDKAVREILKLQGNMKPHQIITLMKYVGYDNTLSLPDHYNHIHVGYAPEDGSGKDLQQLLKPGQWDDLVKRLGSIKVPSVSSTPSQYSVTSTTPTK
ncbi:MAG: lytic murein transglycosylase [Solirubrobacteraceae bacterium]|nr:lytic murein transglycosylase [Patulibacter sp.]